MISIVISTYNSDKFRIFAQGVEDTIGDTPYEIIKIDNPGIMGICEAYNRGIEKAKYSYLCFCHDDIIFRTQDWGLVLINSFKQNKEIGLIGCAGSVYKAWVPSGWSSPPSSFLKKENLIQVKKDGTKIKCSVGMSDNLEAVVSLDGCLLCTKKEVTDEFKFDDKTFRNYHCYDIDFSLQVFSKYKVAVTKDILIEHCSDGSFSSGWLYETYKLHAKWNNLPLMSQNITQEEVRNQEKLAYSFLLSKTIELNTAYLKLLNILFTYKLKKLVGLKEWLLLFRWTIMGFLKKIFNKK